MFKITFGDQRISDELAIRFFKYYFRHKRRRAAGAGATALLPCRSAPGVPTFVNHCIKQRSTAEL